MRNLYKLSIFGLAVAFVVASCSIEKRVHMKGYHIEWKNNKYAAPTDASTTSSVEEKNNKSIEAIQQAEEVAVVAATKVENTVAPVAVVEENTTASVNNNVVAVATKKFNASRPVVAAEKVTKAEAKQILKAVKKANKATKSVPGSDDKTLLYVLAFFIPFLAVGLATDWDVKKVIINILLSMLCGIPGIIHAFIVVKNS